MGLTNKEQGIKLSGFMAALIACQGARHDQLSGFITAVMFYGNCQVS